MRFLLIIGVFLTLNFLGYSQGDGKIQSLVQQGNDVYFSDPDSAFSYYAKALTLIDENTSDETVTELYVSLGVYHLVKAELNTASDYLNEALELTKGIDLANEAVIYKLKANIAGRMKDYEINLQYINKSLSLYREIGDTTEYIGTLLNSFMVHRKLNDTASAIAVIDTLTAYKAHITGTTEYYYYQNVGSMNLMLGNHDKAEEYYLMAHGITEERDMIDSRATVLMLLGEAAMLRGDYLDSEQYLTDAIELSKAHNLIHDSA